MILYHHSSKRLLRGVSTLLRELAGLDLKHVADRSLFHEVRRGWRHAQDRIHAGLFSDGLRQRRSRQEKKCKAGSQIFHCRALSRLGKYSKPIGGASNRSPAAGFAKISFEVFGRVFIEGGGRPNLPLPQKAPSCPQ